MPDATLTMVQANEFIMTGYLKVSSFVASTKVFCKAQKTNA